MRMLSCSADSQRKYANAGRTLSISALCFMIAYLVTSGVYTTPCNSIEESNWLSRGYCHQ